MSVKYSALQSTNFTRFYLSADELVGGFEISYALNAILPVLSGINTFYLLTREEETSGNS